MTLIDDIKDSIPEGKYLELCNTMKDTYENKPIVITNRWIDYTNEADDIGSYIIDLLDIDDNKIKCSIHIKTFHFLPMDVSNNYREKYEFTIDIKHIDVLKDGTSIVRNRVNDMRLDKTALKECICRLATLYDIYTFHYEYTTLCNGIYPEVAISYNHYDYIKERVKSFTQSLKIDALIDKEHGYEEEDDVLEQQRDQFFEELKTDSEKDFRHAISYRIVDDMEKVVKLHYISKHVSTR